MSEETKDFPNKITNLDNLYNQINELVPGCVPGIPVTKALEYILAELRRLKEIELMFSDHKEFKCPLTAVKEGMQ